MLWCFFAILSRVGFVGHVSAPTVPCSPTPSRVMVPINIFSHVLIIYFGNMGNHTMASRSIFQWLGTCPHNRGGGGSHPAGAEASALSGPTPDPPTVVTWVLLPPAPAPRLTSRKGGKDWSIPTRQILVRVSAGMGNGGSRGGTCVHGFVSVAVSQCPLGASVRANRMALISWPHRHCHGGSVGSAFSALGQPHRSGWASRVPLHPWGAQPKGAGESR